MWAPSLLSPAEQNKNTRRGFTIVELLIVIVVIAILAAITIVAYSGITQRARVATVSSDLEGAAKQLAIDQTLTSAYPATVAAANNGAGLKASPGTTYQYAVNNTVSPQTFCITATNGTTSYYASSTNNVPTAGACQITNLVTNPSVEASANNWDANYGTGGAGSSALTTGGAYSGNGFYRITWTTGSSDIQRGAEVISQSPLSATETYTASAWVRLNRVQRMTLMILFTTAVNGGVGTAQITGTAVVVQPNTWTRLSVTGTAVTGSLSANVRMYSASGTSGTTWQAGDTLDVDAVTLIDGSTLYGYADGSSPNWTWNGTPNASTSTGLPL